MKMRRKPAVFLLITFTGLVCVALISFYILNKPNPSETQGAIFSKTVPVTPPVHLLQPVPTALLDQAKNEWRDVLAKARQNWLALNITSYEIKISFEDTTWNPIEYYDVIVRNNIVSQKNSEVKDPRCCARGTPYPALVDFDANRYTVPGMFDIAYSQVEAKWFEDTYFNIEFDKDYGFPKEIILSSYRYSDVQKIWTVEEFKK